LISEARNQGIKEALSFLRSPRRLEFMAREAMLLGLTLQQAWGVIRLFDIAVALAYASEDAWLDATEPDWEAIAKEAGQPPDLKGWLAWWNGLLDPPETPAGKVN
jgi:hypothetical protein